MPRLSDSMVEGTILRWLVAEGDAVEAGQPLVEIETDKATVIHEAQEGGVVLGLTVGEGAVVPVGAPIAVLGEASEELPVQSPSGALTVGAQSSAAARTTAGARVSRLHRALSDPGALQGLAARPPARR